MGNPSVVKTSHAFIKEIIRLHGLPSNIFSDRGVQFTSRFWKALCRFLKVEQRHSFAYYPQAMDKLNIQIKPWGNIYIVSQPSLKMTRHLCSPWRSLHMTIKFIQLQKQISTFGPIMDSIIPVCQIPCLNQHYPQYQTDSPLYK